MKDFSETVCNLLHRKRANPPCKPVRQSAAAGAHTHKLHRRTAELYEGFDIDQSDLNSPADTDPMFFTREFTVPCRAARKQYSA